MITLHHVAFSRSFRILWLLEELGLEYDVTHYSIRDGGLRDPGFLKLSPAGRVPALELDGAVLFESGAITQVLCEREASALAPGPGDAERARYLEALGYAETMAGLIEQLNVQHVFLRDPAQASPMVIKLTTARLAASLRGMEALLEHAHILPSGFSAADTMMGFNLFAAPYFVPLDPFPRIRAYRARLEARPAFRRARDRDGPQDFYTRDFYPVPEG